MPLPQYFSMILRGSEASVSQHTLNCVPHTKIVFLHGFMQDHKCWLGTARKLCSTWGHDCLLLDFYGHGASPFLGKHTDLDVSVLVQQVRDLVLRQRWSEAHGKIVLAGISMGGAVAQLYSMQYPENVERLVLLAAGGLSECQYHPMYVFRRVASRVSRVCAECAYQERSLSHRFLSLLHLVKAAPDYGIPQSDITEHLRQFPLTLIWGGLDAIHSAQLRRRHGGREEKDGVYTLFVPCIGHLLCACADWLQLHKRGHYWHGAASNAKAAGSYAAVRLGHSSGVMSRL